MLRMRSTLTACAWALALPLSALAAGQPPAATARPHPASSAHAAATAGQANAARIETCSNRSSTMLDALAKGDFKAAERHYDARMAAALDASKLAGVWKSVGAQFGALQSRGSVQTMMYQGLPVIVTALKFARGSLNAQVACNADGTIAGFHLQPPSVPAASPPA